MADKVGYYQDKRGRAFSTPIEAVASDISAILGIGQTPAMHILRHRSAIEIAFDDLDRLAPPAEKAEA